MASYERTYATARTMFWILETVALLVVLGGIIVLFAGLSQLSEIRSEFEAFATFGGIAAGILFTLVGLISVAFVQTSRASVDQAEMTRDMLGLMRQSGEKPSGGRQEASAGVSSAAVGNVIKTHRGYPIVKHEDGVSVSGSVFENVLKAEEFINGMERGQ